MRNLKLLLIICTAFINLISIQLIFSQNITADTTLANQYFSSAITFESSRMSDSAIFCYKEAQTLYIKNLGEKCLKNANTMHLLGRVYYTTGKNDSALAYTFKALKIRQEILGEKHLDVIKSYNNLALICLNKYEFDTALQYQQKALKLRLEILGEKHPDVAMNYKNIGNIYIYKDKYDLALEYFFKSLKILKELPVEKQEDIAACYNNIGIAYENKTEYDLALEYQLKGLKMRKEIFGEKNLNVANSYNNTGNIYKKKGEYNLALEYHLKSLEIKKEIFGEDNINLINSYNNIGVIYNDKSDYDSALQNYFKALKIEKETLGENDISIATSLNNIGNTYININEYDSALQYLFKSLQKRKELLGENSIDVASSYINIGNVYNARNEFDLALKYYFKALYIQKEILGENHAYLATSYNNIGNIYWNKNEYDLALEYHFKALQIRKENLGEKDLDVALSYGNIAGIYSDKMDYDLALEYYFKSLEIQKEKLDENSQDIARTYNNLGVVYWHRDEYELALEYQFKNLQILKNIFDPKNIAFAACFKNIAAVYSSKLEYNNAMEYHFKALQVEKEIFGEKHADMASSYNNVGSVYKSLQKHDLSLKYYQKGLVSSLRNFNDSSDVFHTPIIDDILNWNYLLQALQVKAQIFSDSSINLQNLKKTERLKIALKHYQACDTLISQVRKEINTQSDKLALGEKANQIYDEAIVVCLRLANEEKNRRLSQDYRQLAFYFSEKNKSSVLLEALAGQEAQKFAGIPDSLLEKEHHLKTDIAFYNKQLAEPENLDSATLWRYNDRMFRCNRTYDSLIIIFENRFPEYFALKYNNRVSSIKNIQELLDKQSAIVSYVSDKSSITIFTLTRKSFEVFSIPKMEDFSGKIEIFRNALISSKKSSLKSYRDLAYVFYQQLFPFLSQSKNFDKITNLILIPDGELSTIPFEALLTKQINAELKSIESFKDLPYLINRFNISYSYSAKLFCKTFEKEKTSNPELADLKDWIAFAPVFDDQNIAGLTANTRKMKKMIQTENRDSVLTRGFFMGNGDAIPPLPGSELEVKTLFDSFEAHNKSAVMKLRGDANEEFIKSGELSKYKIIHIATHGLVNPEKPELSCILLSQADTTTQINPELDDQKDLDLEQNDNVLYQGEIFNIKLNSDLVVLSACETGLGKIKSGEGIIGLTRALLYAGTKNIIVSLWQVSDKSTSDLMINFYENLFAQKSDKYAESLRNSKLKMIKEGNFSHPFFWSPFILIGR